MSDIGGENNLRYDNSGSSEFTRVTDQSEVLEGGNSTGVLWLDYNQDSYIDLFVSNLGDEKNFLYINSSDLTLQKINTGAIVNDIADSWGIAATDYDNDGHIDIFVANSGGEPAQKNSLYKNAGDGTFIPILSGNPIVEAIEQSSGGSWGDYDNDGDQDLYVTNMGLVPNELYNNMGSGSFKKITTLSITSDTSSSRSSTWIDYDNNGWLDLFVVNSAGHNMLYRNMGSGNFELSDFGPLIYDQYISRGAAWADYDRDGDLDIVATGSTDSSVYIYRNNIADNNWVEFALKGTISNAAAIGARVLLKSVIDGSPRWQMREISTQSGPMSQNEMVAHFGLGNASSIDSVVIIWPSGIMQVMSNMAINKRIVVEEQIPEYPVPELVSPANHATDVDLHPLFVWKHVEGAVSYTLELSKFSDFSDLILNVPNLVDSSYQMYPWAHRWKRSPTISGVSELYMI